MNLTAFKQSSKSDNPHYLLFGHPVEHSWSPLMHNTALEYYGIDAEYHAVDLQSHELADLAAYLNNDKFLGANVTIPYKQLIAEYLDDISSSASEIGAINTIVKKNHLLEGHNTDCDGFLAPLQKLEFDFAGQDAIVFGTGGASKAIVVAFIELGIENVYLVSRTPKRISSFNNFEQVQLVSYHEWSSLAGNVMLIVNATPLGMHPNIDKSPVRDSETQFLRDRICYDIVYNPIKTQFLQQAKNAGATTISGLEMLIQQGSRSFELWTGRPFPIEIIRNSLNERLKD
jgi:shikimate dehydrogenase